jgi:tetratricopeptide (TPR) repeat protein
MKWNSLALSLMVAGAIVTLPSIGMSQSQFQNSEARRLFNDGRELQDHGRLLEAERKYRDALRMYPRADQSDKTQYYLIDVLVKLRKLENARSEINQFLAKFPKSVWVEDVDQLIFQLGGITTASGAIWNSAEEVRAAQYLDDLRNGRPFTAFGPPEKIYPTSRPSNADRNAVLLFQILQMDPEMGIEEAKELLKGDPSNAAVIANLSGIANSKSPQSVPLLQGIWTNPATSPNARNQAFFWYGRSNPDKEAVAKAILKLLESRETEVVASEALSLMTIPHHREVLGYVATSSHPNKFELMKKIYRRGSVRLRTDLLESIARLSDSRAVPFLMDAAQNDEDDTVRRVAAEKLMNRKDVDVNTFKNLLNTPPPVRRVPQQQPLPFVPQTSGRTGSN